MSQQLKFKKFHLAKLYRKQTTARHYRTGQEFNLLPTNSLRSLINIDCNNAKVEEKNCMHLSIPSIYVSASGNISKCCYLASSEPLQTIDQTLRIGPNLTNKICIKNCG
jgi:hypothetical protein